jgi:hypothetical protein
MDDPIWAVVSSALVTRMTASVEAILHLRTLKRTADEVVLGRSIYDHATTFAWLSADTESERLDQFLLSDAVERLKFGNECEALGINMLDRDTREHFEEIRNTQEKRMPPLEQRARQADTDWGEMLPEHSTAPFMSYFGQYTAFYRYQSGHEHPSTMGLLAFSDDQPDGSRVVGMEEEDDDDLLGSVVIAYMWSLCIASRTLGWPDENDITEVFVSE